MGFQNHEILWRGSPGLVCWIGGHSSSVPSSKVHDGIDDLHTGRAVDMSPEQCLELETPGCFDHMRKYGTLWESGQIGHMENCGHIV